MPNPMPLPMNAARQSSLGGGLKLLGLPGEKGKLTADSVEDALPGVRGPPTASGLRSGARAVSFIVSKACWLAAMAALRYASEPVSVEPISHFPGKIIFGSETKGRKWAVENRACLPETLALCEKPPAGAQIVRCRENLLGRGVIGGAIRTRTKDPDSRATGSAVTDGCNASRLTGHQTSKFSAYANAICHNT
jgi:hypothetical protein